MTTYTRRRTLALSGSALVAAVGGGCLDASEMVTTVELRATEEGWVGETPEAIRGATNPTLALKTGETYELVWLNEDGATHKLALLDEKGEVVHDSKTAKERGEQRTVAFRAEPKLVAYHDHYHPETLKGEVSVGGSGVTANES
ncbi:cupredoxin domain-containing protein [Halomarina litorea]|uniref:cupredoxin domain-containing protein n=1 Tax=Halomarina litorea TaxID=2961595 RepID=UPI0020C4B9CD|nr:hypothetical protein [Halomarina sp. BCD28]